MNLPIATSSAFFLDLYARYRRDLRVLKSMWTFLADGERQEQTSVVPNLLLRAKAPDRTRNEIGDPNRIDEDRE